MYSKETNKTYFLETYTNCEDELAKHTLAHYRRDLNPYFLENTNAVLRFFKKRLFLNIIQKEALLYD